MRKQEREGDRPLKLQKHCQGEVSSSERAPSWSNSAQVRFVWKKPSEDESSSDSEGSAQRAAVGTGILTYEVERTALGSVARLWDHMRSAHGLKPDEFRAITSELEGLENLLAEERLPPAKAKRKIGAVASVAVPEAGSKVLCVIQDRSPLQAKLTASFARNMCVWSLDHIVRPLRRGKPLLSVASSA